MKLIKRINNDNQAKSLAVTEEQWFDLAEEEGQLSVDVYQQGDKIIVKSTMAGAQPENIEISVHNDMLTIKGKREMSQEVDYQDYLYRECYWGKFSRTIILPEPIKEDKVTADLENGLLTIILPKADHRDHLIKVKQK